MRAAKICGGAKTRTRVSKIEPSPKPVSARWCGELPPPGCFAFSEYLTWIKAKIASSPI
jgi:hypothetical protein